jgi:hypothetical protein
VYVRLERLGFRVGEGLSERFSRDRPRFQNYAGSGPGMAGAGSGGSGTGAGGAPTVGIGNINDHHLDVIKFLCKDIWTVVWKKQVDNLKTNHRVRENTKNLPIRVYAHAHARPPGQILSIPRGETDSSARHVFKSSQVFMC